MERADPVDIELDELELNPITREMMKKVPKVQAAIQKVKEVAHDFKTRVSSPTASRRQCQSSQRAFYLRSELSKRRTIWAAPQRS